MSSTRSTELEATLEISRWASSSLDASEAIGAILAITARGPGVARVAIDWDSDAQQKAHRLVSEISTTIA